MIKVTDAELSGLVAGIVREEGEQVTERGIRRSLEKRLLLDPMSMDEKEAKLRIKKIVANILENGLPADPPSIPDKSKSATKTAAPKAPKAPKASKARKPPTRPAARKGKKRVVEAEDDSEADSGKENEGMNVVDDDEGDDENVPRYKSKPRQTKKLAVSEDSEEEEEGVEDDDEDEEDPVPVRASKHKSTPKHAAQSSEKAAKKRAISDSENELEAKSTDSLPLEDMDDEDESRKASPVPTVKPPTQSAAKKARTRVISDSEDDGEAESGGEEEGKEEDHDSKASSMDEDSEKEERKGKKVKPTEKKKASKKPSEANGGTKADVVISEKDAKEIERLKGYVVKCGVRKIWGIEFKGKSGRERIAHLKSMLDDLGVKGRPSLEQSKKIKFEREWAQERAELDASNILDTGRASRRARGSIGGGGAVKRQRDPDVEMQRKADMAKLAALCDPESDD
ncbi:hypothetical protein HDU67_005629 [Dinochytrium kinnereticum]|nr:hypothetical protein HDU67_005629 [Dinochytrium kinnereticum]